MNSRQSLEDAIARVAPGFLEIPGVAGVYEGTLEDGRDCIKVAISVPPSELSDSLPKEAEGYPVILVHTGPIAPH